MHITLRTIAVCALAGAATGLIAGCGDSSTPAADTAATTARAAGGAEPSSQPACRRVNEPDGFSNVVVNLINESSQPLTINALNEGDPYSYTTFTLHPNRPGFKMTCIGGTVSGVDLIANVTFREWVPDGKKRRQYLGWKNPKPGTDDMRCCGPDYDDYVNFPNVGDSHTWTVTGDEPPVTAPIATTGVRIANRNGLPQWNVTFTDR